MSEELTTDGQTREYEHLRTKQNERRGNTELATVSDVWVGESEVVLRLTFEWTTDPARVRYDLDDDRDVCKLETLANAEGFDFDQVAHLEGSRIEATYTGDEWIPRAHESYVEGEGSVRETFRTELLLLLRELARSPGILRHAVQRVRSMDLQQTIIAVVLVKKVLLVVLLAWYLI